MIHNIYWLMYILSVLVDGKLLRCLAACVIHVWGDASFIDQLHFVLLDDFFFPNFLIDKNYVIFWRLSPEGSFGCL